jgi:RsiW-degrading membrane proteinase PrsW (M82 family)
MSNPAVLLLSLLAAAIPTLFYVTLVYWVDQYEKEPLWLLVLTFLWGAVPAIILAFVFNSILGIPVYVLASESQFADTAVAVFVAPFVEETVKAFILLAIFFFWRQEIDSPLDGVIYGAMVGFGFAMVENVFYFMAEYQAGGAEAWGTNIVLRSLIFGLNHALFASMMGLGIAIGRLSPRPFTKVMAPVLGWGAAVFFHFMHNLTIAIGSVFICFTFIFDWGGVWLIIVIILWSLVQERSWIKKYLADEVGQGTMTTRQYQLACSGYERMWFSLEMLVARGYRANRQSAHFFHRCSELAYKKHHQTLFTDNKNAETILRLRREIVDLGRQL